MLMLCSGNVMTDQCTVYSDYYILYTDQRRDSKSVWLKWTGSRQQSVLQCSLCDAKAKYLSRFLEEIHEGTKSHYVQVNLTIYLITPLKYYYTGTIWLKIVMSDAGRAY